MLRHQVQFVLRFGTYDDFRQLLERLHTAERRHDWPEQRCWRTATGRMNELMIEHLYADRAAYEAQRDAYHDSGDGDFAAALAALAQLMVPGTATEVLLEEV
jgi:hypothetical protein